MSTAPVTPRPHAVRWGQLVWGGALLVIGVAWFLDVSVGLGVAYPIVLAGLLIAVGVALPLAPAHDRGGVLGLGVVLSIAVLASAIAGPAVDPFAVRRGVGNVTERPVAAAAVRDHYEHGVGDLSIDLRSLSLPPGETAVAAELAIGTLTIEVPPDVAVDVSGEAGLGVVEVFGQERSGVGPTLRTRTSATSDARSLEVDASVGIGRIEVTR